MFIGFFFDFIFLCAFRAQIMAYRMLARNQPLNPQIIHAVQGKRQDGTPLCPTPPSSPFQPQGPPGQPQQPVRTMRYNGINIKSLHRREKKSYK